MTVGLSWSHKTCNLARINLHRAEASKILAAGNGRFRSTKMAARTTSSCGCAERISSIYNELKFTQIARDQRSQAE